MGILRRLRAAGGKALEERMTATLREMGVTFDLTRDNPWGRQPWHCDLLPHIFAADDWDRLVRGFRQRIAAWELFLEDVYGKKEILREGAVPIHAVLASSRYQHAAAGLPRPGGTFLHVCGLCVARDAQGVLRVREHRLAHAAGISYMLQNRRALARVAPELFGDAAVASLAEAPVRVLEHFRAGTAAAFDGDPAVVLLSPGTGNASAAELAFMARRMGVPLVQGGDLLVLNDRVHLRTVRGLEPVDVIASRVADEWLDPLVFRKESRLGVPGLVHCLRRGTVALINPVGCELADDPAVLAFAPQIIRFYLGEAPILPNVPTHWMGDLDQREMVLDRMDDFAVRPVGNTRRAPLKVPPGEDPRKVLAAEIRRYPAMWVAQERLAPAATLCWEGGVPVQRSQDHVLYAVAEAGKPAQVFPGALTRLYGAGGWEQAGILSTSSKDTWVLENPGVQPLLKVNVRMPAERGRAQRQVTSRVADAFYWMGRYLERAQHLASIISVVETLETEELDSAERKLYRPMWTRLLPPLDKAGGKANGAARRSMSDKLDRYRLVLATEPGSVRRTFGRALSNADTVQDAISPEAWATLNELRSRLERTRQRQKPTEEEAVRTTRRIADAATKLIPQFFGVCAHTMLADDGWRFCEVGQMLERSLITANSLWEIRDSLSQRPNAARQEGSHGTELQLSVFLRLLSCRDAYRRIYQMRAEPWAVLDLLWQHPQVPRSVVHCLEECGTLLRASMSPEMLADTNVTPAIDALVHRIRRVDWTQYVSIPADEDLPATPSISPQPRGLEMAPLLAQLLEETLGVHTAIADAFLNHQARIAQMAQPRLVGM